MKYLINIIFVTISFSVDILSVGFPNNAKALASSGYGVAFDEAYSINPASISNNNMTRFEFSNNNWIFDIRGSYLSHIDNNMKLSGFYWQVDDIEMYGDTPSDSPLSTFGSKTLVLNSAQGFNFNNHQLGYSLKYAYMKLLEYEDKGFVLDLGYRYQFSKGSSVGLVIKNLNTGFKDESQLPEIVILGTSQKVKNIPVTLNLDVFNNSSQDISGIYQGLVIDSKYLNLLAGYSYINESEETDISLGVNFLWNNLEFSISTLIKENDEIGNPIFYQLSYRL